ncbi:MAG: hypothetical protein ACRDQB_17305 [Thermocrispum sp.]
MADDKPALVLHLSAGGDPLLFALSKEGLETLHKRLPLWLEHGSTEQVETQDGATISVNFGHVAVAYVDDLQRRGKVFGLR